jgi:DNA ligase (NAD+)
MVLMDVLQRRRAARCHPAPRRATTSTTIRDHRREFDRLLHGSSGRSGASDLVTPDSPRSASTGRAVEGFATVVHLEPMLSLDNAVRAERALRRAGPRGIARLPSGRLQRGSLDPPADELRRTSVPVAYVAELKIDGLSIALTYENGRRCAKHAR